MSRWMIKTICFYLIFFAASSYAVQIKNVRSGRHDLFQRVTIICQGDRPKRVVQQDHAVTLFFKAVNASPEVFNLMSEQAKKLTCVHRVSLEKDKIQFQFARNRVVDCFTLAGPGDNYRVVLDFKKKNVTQGKIRTPKVVVLQKVRFGVHPGFKRLTFVFAGQLPEKITVGHGQGVVLFPGLKVSPGAEQYLNKLHVKEVATKIKEKRLIVRSKLSIHPLILPDREKRMGYYRLVMDFTPHGSTCVEPALHESQSDHGAEPGYEPGGQQIGTEAKEIAQSLAGAEQARSTSSVVNAGSEGNNKQSQIFISQEYTRSSPSASDQQARLPEKFLVLPTNGEMLPKEPEAGSEKGRLRLSGKLLVRGTIDLLDNGGEQKQGLRSKVRTEIHYDLPWEKGTGHSDGAYLILSAEAQGLWAGPYDGYASHDLLPYEAYFCLKKGILDLRVGKQVVRWGKTDQISPVDNINPQDLREFYIQDLEERKIPTWLARLQLIGGQVSLEGIFIPFFKPNEVDYFGSDWAVYNHLKSNVQDDPALPPELQAYIAGLSVDEDRPGCSLKNSQAGGRLLFTVGDWDLGLSYLYGFDPMPFFASFPIKNIKVRDTASKEDLLAQAAGALFTSGPIKVEYKRMQVAGLAFETTLGDFGFRGETAYFSGRSFLSEDMTSEKNPVWQYVLGLDYLGENDWYCNVQLSQEVIFSYSPDLLYFKRNNLSINGELRKDFSEGNLRLGMRYVYTLTDGSYFLTPYLLCKPFSNWEAEFGVNILGGSQETIWGQYDGNDQLYLKVERFF